MTIEPSGITRTRAMWLCGLLLLAALAPAHGAGSALLSLEELGSVNVFAADVLTSHIHRKGEWMLGYGMMRMSMDGPRRGTARLTTEEVRALGFPVVPTKMETRAHMLHLMYALSDTTTLALAGARVEKRMEHDHPGGSFTTRSAGWGDVKAKLNHLLHEREYGWGEARLLAHLGISVPVGATSRRDDTPAGRQLMPYPMQLGSGTWDGVAGIGIDALTMRWHWGAQILLTRPLESRNAHGYRLGRELEAEAWGSWALNDAVNLTARLRGLRRDEVHGTDERLMGAPAPTFRTDMRGSDTVSLGLGVTFKLPALAGDHQLSLEVTTPLHQEVDGVQLTMRPGVRASWRHVL